MGRNEMSCRIHYTPSRPVDIGIATLTKIQIEHTNTQPFSTRMSSGCIWLRSRWLRISQSLDTETQTHYEPHPQNHPAKNATGRLAERIVLEIFTHGNRTGHHTTPRKWASIGFGKRNFFAGSIKPD
jgi:hypothetical protein